MAKVLLFAQARDAAGCAEIDWPNGAGQGAKELWEWLLESFPRLRPVKAHARLARNGSYLRGGEVFAPEDEIAVIPPVSGG